MGFELVDEPGFFLDGRQVRRMAGLPTGQVGSAVVGVAALQFSADAGHFGQRCDQWVVVVGDRDAGLEYFAVPLGIELLELADQVARLGISGCLVA